ncbi:LysR family transcriptional regulator [Aminobacter sp. AP02]|uniref:LysR family transcriptional regulator n=1 Tax=Aminobacter sp. AP02 TaxID=2135737 RepID=UPI000D6D5CA1|nr:LysR family transcriptional regulator [Aminobacter sp. AP02]PWK63034.1 LysR family transcriptional regulator [Aminobacter sp. AP02]
MNLKQLQYFYMLAEELHFRRAAEKLNITQSPLSIAIQNLEQELGCQLFVRTQRRVQLTEVGERLRDHARSIIEKVEFCEQDLAAVVSGKAGQLRIGFTSASSLLSPFPALIHAFRREYPDIDVSLKEAATLVQLDSIQNRDLDVGVIRRPRQQLATAISFRKLKTDKLVVAMHSSHPLLEREEVRIADLAGERFIFFPRKMGVGIYDQFIELCGKRGFMPDIVQESQSTTTIVGLVAAGLGVAIVPSGLAYIQIPNVAFKTLADADAETDLLLAYRAGEENPRLAHLIRLAQVAFAQAET